MSRPRVGITASEARDETGAVHPDVAPYVAAVERAGGEPVLFPNDAAAAAELAAGVDAVVISGGVDVDPARYGGNPLHGRSQAGRYRADRDAFELALARATRDAGIPTLAICRGLQVVNVAFGGTLLEDVRDELGRAYDIEHRQTTETGLDRSDYAPRHEVDVEPGSALERLAGSTRFPVNSMHHQAIRKLGDGLRATARTSDGIVEAVEATFAHPFFVGVQWHPEELAGDTVSEGLFSGLIGSIVKAR